jgi:peroxiredoxin (alkyl hydroperoxide reductase subunit C)
MEIQIGDKAPDFKAEAYFQGMIQEIQLSNYRGQWVLLLFYPGDFTFV